MTTPNQTLPTTVETLLGIGAYQIGGGGTAFGQDIDDDFVDALVKIPYATLDTMIDVLQMVLLRLPIEALQAFSSLIPDWLEEPIYDVATAVGLIIDALQARDIPMLLSVFENFVEDMLDSLGIPILGDLIDKIFDLTDGFDTLFGGFDILDGGILNQLVNALTGSGGDLTDITAWVADIPILGDIVEAITGVLGGDLTDLTSWSDNVPGLSELVEALTGVIGGDFTDITDWVSDIPVIGDIIAMIVEAITGIIGGDTTDLTSWANDVPIIGDLVDALTGTTGDLTDLDSFFSDLFGILGGTGPTGAGVLGDIFDRLQNLDPTGLFDAAGLDNIANIPAIAQSKITGLTASLASLLSATSFQDLLDKLYQAINGGASTGNTAAAVKTAFQAIPQANITGLTTLAGNVTTGFQNIYNTWFGGTSATGTAAELATTVGAIQDAIYGDFTVSTFTSSNASWTIPSGVTQMIGGCIGGGGKGADGQTGTSGTTRYLGGNGGTGGGIVIGNPLDLTGLTPGTSTLNITVGAAATSVNTNGGASSIVGGSNSLASEPDANAEIRQVSIYPTAAQACAGGRGGDVQNDITLASAGTAGSSNGISTGGAGGSGNTSGHGTSGSAGQDGEYTDNPKYGGAGGGGGGAGRLQATANVTGGNGGAGGFPGGGGGGGGAARNDPIPGGQIAGAAGTPAAGLVWIMYK